MAGKIFAQKLSESTKKQEEKCNFIKMGFTKGHLQVAVSDCRIDPPSNCRIKNALICN